MKNNIQNNWRWESAKINELELTCQNLKRPSDRLLFLIDSFGDYYSNYTHGQYEWDLMIEEYEIVLRLEYLQFLGEKYSEFKQDFGSLLSKIDNNGKDNDSLTRV